MSSSITDDLKPELLQRLILDEIRRMDNLFGVGPNAQRTAGQYYVFAEGFKDPASDDAQKSGAPISAYSFLGFGVTHEPTGGTAGGTKKPGNLIVYGDYSSLFPLVQHLIAGKQKAGSNSPIFIGVSIYDNIYGEKEKATRKSRTVFVFWGSMLYGLSSIGKAYIIFSGLNSYDFAQSADDDKGPQGSHAFRLVAPNKQKDNEILDRGK